MAAVNASATPTTIIRIATDRWTLPPRMNNRFPVRANFGEGVTLYDINLKAWVTLDPDGFVDVTPGHSYLVTQLSQANILEKSKDPQLKKVKLEPNRAKRNNISGYMLFIKHMVDQSVKSSTAHPSFKDVSTNWATLTPEEKEKWGKLAKAEREKHAVLEDAETQVAQSTSSEVPPSRPPKVKKSKHSETTAAPETVEKDLQVAKKKKTRHLAAVDAAPTLTSPPQVTPTAASTLSTSQKSKEKRPEVKPLKPSSSSSSSTSTSSQQRRPTEKPSVALVNEFASHSEDEDDDEGSDESDE